MTESRTVGPFTLMPDSSRPGNIIIRTTKREPSVSADESAELVEAIHWAMDGAAQLSAAASRGVETVAFRRAGETDEAFRARVAASPSVRFAVNVEPPSDSDVVEGPPGVFRVRDDGNP